MSFRGESLPKGGVVPTENPIRGSRDDDSGPSEVGEAD